MKKRRRRKDRLIVVAGEIGDALVRELYGIPDTARWIDVHVCSPGGSFASAVAVIEIFHRWMRQKKTVRTVAIGEAVSAASMIVASGTPGRRYSYRSTSWGLHLPFLSGDQIEEHRSQKSDSKLLAQMAAQYYHLMAAATGRTQKEWKQMLAREATVWLDGRQAREWGLVDEVIE